MKPHRLAVAPRLQPEAALPETPPAVIEYKADRIADDVSALYNCCWWVRHFERGNRLESVAIRRKQAIQKLGLTCREIFKHTDDHDFEPVLTALVDGLRPRDDNPPF